MLVLSRKLDDEIRLPDVGITIRVLKVKGKAVTIGIAAPKNLRILRGELSDFLAAELPPTGVCMAG